MGHSEVDAPGSTALRHNLWVQLAIGIVCMGLVANLQYAWTLFVVPMDAAHHWGQAAIQTAITIFIVTEIWLVPVEGWLVDKFGPRPVVIGGSLCAAKGTASMLVPIASVLSAHGSWNTVHLCSGRIDRSGGVREIRPRSDETALDRPYGCGWRAHQGISLITGYGHVCLMKALRHR
ncbi:hypothetical protein SAMN05446635_7596 [Burkholderia sp. OK233]|nr:hypothetical protein SAMN05446635_7596 [Burkholderia sp. OK233]